MIDLFLLLLTIYPDTIISKKAPPLPPPKGQVIYVETPQQLWEAVRDVTSDTTISIAPGTYRLPNTLHFNTPGKNIAIRGATGNPSDVVLIGNGMTNKTYGTVPHGILVTAVEDILIADLTIQDVYFHPIQLTGGSGCQRPRVYNCRLIDAGEQFIKVSGGVNGGIVEYTVMEYTSTARSWYTNGVDVLSGTDWLIRHCLFQNIRAPEDTSPFGNQPQRQLAGPAVLMWRGSRNTVCEANQFINCERGIAFGLDGEREDDHAGGIIRNNMIYRASDIQGDVGISAWNSPQTQILHNTVILSQTYPNAIEYRFPATTGVTIAYNLCDTAIAGRDGAMATLLDNVTRIQPIWFVSLSNGDLRLRVEALKELRRAIPLTEVTTDFDGNRRIVDGTTDIGADEHQASNTLSD